MIINNLKPYANLYGATAIGTTKKSAQVSKSFKDEMLLSNEAQSFKAMLSKLKNVSEVRQDKVDQYSQMIQNGTYDVKSENIAASLLNNLY